MEEKTSTSKRGCGLKAYWAEKKLIRQIRDETIKQIAQQSLEDKAILSLLNPGPVPIHPLPKSNEASTRTRSESAKKSWLTRKQQQQQTDIQPSTSPAEQILSSTVYQPAKPKRSQREAALERWRKIREEKALLKKKNTQQNSTTEANKSTAKAAAVSLDQDRNESVLVTSAFIVTKEESPKKRVRMLEVPASAATTGAIPHLQFVNSPE